MHNPFLIIRLVFLLLLGYLSLVTLAFASWNIHTTTSRESPIPRLAVCLMFNSIALFLLVTLAMVAPAARTARVGFECCWIVIFTVLQFAATVSTTAVGPFICQSGTGNWEACASSSLMVPSAWLSTFTLLTYLFVLFCSTFAHWSTRPAIWSATVISVPWFTQCKSDAHGGVTCHPSDKNNSQQCCCLKKGDIETPFDIPKKGNGHGQQPPWAQRLHIRRGVDKPFAQNTSTSSNTSNRSSPTTATVPLPPPSAPTQQSKLAQPEGSRFIERFQELNVQPSAPWWETPSQYGLQLTPHTEVFPRKVDDHDLPILLPRLSGWIRADAVRRTNIHTPPP